MIPGRCPPACGCGRRKTAQSAGESVSALIALITMAALIVTDISRDGLKTGYVPQRMAMEATIPISARSFITLRRRAAADDFRRTVEETGIASILSKPLHVLSGGEMQRLRVELQLAGFNLGQIEYIVDQC